MPQFDLATLSGPELRGLLDSTRQRGQAAESYKILREMAERRERPGLRGSRVIAVDLGDPLAPKDPLAEPAVGIDPARPLATDPQAVADDFGLDLAQAVQARRPPPKAAKAVKAAKARRAREPAWDAPRRRPRRWRGPSLAAAGAALGLLVGLGVARETFSEPAPAVAVFPQAPMLRPDPVAAPAPALTVAVEPLAPAPEPVEVAQLPPAAPAPQAAEPEPVAEPPPTEVAASEPHPACPAAGAPADLAICADPALQRLQRKLRQAYADALDAHADRTTLRQRQLAWREARNAVADPERLARLYQARIRRLEAATADARRGRE